MTRISLNSNFLEQRLKNITHFLNFSLLVSLRREETNAVAVIRVAIGGGTVAAVDAVPGTNGEVPGAVDAVLGANGEGVTLDAASAAIGGGTVAAVNAVLGANGEGVTDDAAGVAIGGGTAAALDAVLGANGEEGTAAAASRAAIGVAVSATTRKRNVAVGFFNLK
jgi:hypothetical protein